MKEAIDDKQIIGGKKAIAIQINLLISRTKSVKNVLFINRPIYQSIYSFNRQFFNSNLSALKANNL